MDLVKVLDASFRLQPAAFRRLSSEGVTLESEAGRKILRVAPETLKQLAYEAFRDVNFFLRRGHLAQWEKILEDNAASENDRFVAAVLLKSAAVAAEGFLPLCQDTGTATIVALKGEAVYTGGNDAAELEEGVRQAYAGHHLRFSQMAPLSMLGDRNTGTNLPAQIEIYASRGAEYRFLFIAKGAGSSNKTALFQESKALLDDRALTAFLREKVRALGVAACPPYHLALVVGGTSPEFNLKLLKLATAGALDHLPNQPEGSGDPYRDSLWETRLLEIAAETKLGAQFGGRHLALDARVIRAARHGGSCPVSLGVSCSAHRNALARITADGVFLESLDRDARRFLPKALAALARIPRAAAAPRIDLDRPVREVCAELSRHAVGTLVLLSGPMVVARDLAHAHFAELLRKGEAVPDYLKRHPVFYAGPSETPPSYVIGSFGPTTAQRMDPYMPDLMARDACLITLAKGPRAPSVAAACRKHGGFYLAAVGGAAALVAKENVVADRIIDLADLGMEAIRQIEVKNLPAFIVIDNKGNDLYAAMGEDRR
jgi:fumarate hydratase class I